MLRENRWAVLNPAGKTKYEREKIRLFDSLEKAQAWVNDGRRVKCGYIVRSIPCKKEEFGSWKVDYSHEITKEILKKIKKTP